VWDLIVFQIGVCGCVGPMYLWDICVGSDCFSDWCVWLCGTDVFVGYLCGIKLFFRLVYVWVCGTDVFVGYLCGV